MISESIVQKVRDVDIVDVIGKYVNLTKKGSSLVGICPFHSEKTPSFSVSPDKNLYYCFSCHRGGDSINFVMDKENLTFAQAIEHIAKDHGLDIEFIDNDQTDEERETALKKESMLVANDLIQKYFTDSLRIDMSDDAQNARGYAYGRWPEELCATFGIGYAPKDSRPFLEYCAKKGISEDTLFLLGILKRGEDNRVYTLFRDRITIPIRNRWGRIIAYTARDISGTSKAKYINSTTSEIFKKSESVFGIDRVRRLRNPDYLIIVEGAPDVLRLQSIGIENVVAALGTEWSDNQFEQIKQLSNSLCFIPDSDIADEKPFGPGFEAVMKNGSAAMLKGFDVTVRELPFAEIPLSEEDLIAMYGDRENTEGVVTTQKGKNDADSYIISSEIYSSLPEKPFVVWLAEKRFCIASSLVEERKYVSEIAGLLRMINDHLVFDSCVDMLTKIHGKAKMWRDAVAKSRNDAKRRVEKSSLMDERQKDVELLRRFGLFIRDNSYYIICDDDEDPVRISNFIMEPLFHIKDELNATRVFRLKNINGETAEIELRESEMCSLSNFQQRVSSLGNYIWPAKIDKLNRVKEYLYAKTPSAEKIRKMGWNISDEFYAFGNGIFIGNQFLAVDDLGIVKTSTGKAYYIPATSKMYRDNHELFQFERLMVHDDRGGISLNGFVSRLTDVFGENARIAFCYLLATLFRDVIFRRTRHFPILNLFGEKGTGKTTLATSLQSFFIHGIDPPNLSVTSIPAMNDRVSQAVNTLVVFDEYKNDLDIRKIGFLKGIWGGGGQTKKNTVSDGMATQTIVTTGLALCGQDKPTQDMALYTRLLFLAFTKTSFNQTERMRYEDLVSVCNMGLTHLTVEILKHRELFEKNFPDTYGLTKRELAARMENEDIHDRIFGNWVIPLATFRTLETVLNLPFSYNDLFETAVNGLRNQNELAQESSEVADFWSNLQGLQTSGKCIDGTHYRIRYLKSFRPLSMAESIEFKEARPILYLNTAAVASLFGSRANNITANRSNWSTILSYLKSHPSYLGLKQDRFVLLNPQGIPDYSFEVVDGKQVRKQRVHRPKALCFDYAQLKDTFGLDLESEVIAESEDIE